MRTYIDLWPTGLVPFGGEDGEGENNSGSGDGSGTGSGGASGEGSQGNSGQGGNGSGKGKGPDESSSNANSDDDDDEFKGLSLAEVKALAKKNAQEKAEAKKELKKKQDAEEAEERKKNDENTNLKKDKEKLESENATLRATVTKQAIEAAIRDDDRYSFHDVELVATVAAKLNPDISVDENGKVEGLKTTLTKVAKQHPFMVKEEKSGEGNNGTNNNGGQSNNGGPTGLQPGQGGTSNGNSGDVDVKVLGENYPALLTRI